MTQTDHAAYVNINKYITYFIEPTFFQAYCELQSVLCVISDFCINVVILNANVGLSDNAELQ